MNAKERNRFARSVRDALGWQDALVHRDLVLERPIGHIARGLSVDRSSDKNACYIWLFVLPLYLPPPHLIQYNTSERARGSPWGLADVGTLAGFLGAEAREYYAYVSTPATFADWHIVHGSKNANLLEARALSMVLADRVSEARAVLDSACGALAGDTRDWAQEMHERCRQLMRGLAHNPSDVKKQLAEWEVQKTQALGLKERDLGSDDGAPRG